MKIKQFKRKISGSIYALLIAVSFLCSPICAQAQTVEYRSQQDALVGTSDSRMVLTIVETTDHVELHVMGIGYIRASGFASSVTYNPTALVLTDETFANDIPNGWDSGVLGSVIKLDPQFLVSYPDISHGYKALAFTHDNAFGGMKYLNLNVHTSNIPESGSAMEFLEEELRPVYRIFFRKQVSGAPLQLSDIGFYGNILLPTISSSWTYDGTRIGFAPLTGTSTAEHINGGLFAYRSPSYAVTAPVTDATGTQATFNGAFKRGDFAPSNMSVTSLTASADTARLNWDKIVNYGFIYATTDHAISVDGVSKEITIDGTAYSFPTPAQLASGQFTFGSTTLNFKSFANSSENQTIASNPVITGLEVDTQYFVWTYLQYSFETSGNYLYVGNKVDFTTLLCEIPAPAIASSEQTLCEPATIADLVAEVESGTTLVWYNAATLGDEYASTDALVDGETYYARAAAGACESASIEVTVTLTSSLAAPSATTPQTFCTGSLVSDLQATGVNIEWYDAEIGGTLISSTEALVDGAIYYAEQASATCVSTTRTAVKVIITDASEINGPVIESPQYFCNNATLADIATDGSTIVWYSAGGALLSSTTYLQNGTTYYAAKAEGDCESTQRTAVLVYTGVTTPLAPQVASPQRMFEGSTLQNIAVPNDKIIWYAAENSTIPLAPGTILADNVTYYAALVAGDCESAVRTPVLILMNGVPGPDVDSPQVVCGDATLADLTVTGSGIVWYDSETGGTELPSSTPLPSTPTWVYAAQSSGSSESDRVGVLVSGSPTPTVVPSPIAICNNGTGSNGLVDEDGNATFDLTESVTPESGYIYVYYDADGNVITDPTKVDTPSAGGTYTYYVKAIDEVTGCEGDMIEITVTINETPEVTVTPAGAYTSVGGETTITVTDNNTNGTQSIIVRDPSIADVVLDNGVITIVGNSRGNTEIVYTSVDENGCVTEVIIPIQVEGAPTGILTGKDIFVCNGDDAQTVQIAYIMGGVAPWTVTISDGTNTQDVVVSSIDDLPKNVDVTLPANTSDVPKFTTYVISQVVDSKNASKDTHYGAVRFGINPTPAVRTIANSTQTICSGSATLPISVDGVATTYRFSVDENIGSINYTNNSVPSFVAINNGTTAITATITIVPEYWYNGIVCIGDSVEATITVKPAPTVAPVENVVLCSEGNLVVNFAGNADEYNWTVSGASIGIPATGTGNINTAVAANNTSAPLVATITVTPKFASVESDCEGNAIRFTVTVTPVATINDVVAEHNLCNGMMTDMINFGGDGAGTIYRWTNSNTSIGLAASGTGNIASFRAINNGLAEATATIIVTPETVNGCVNTAAAKTITIKVQPTPFIAPAFDAAYCVGATVAEVTGTNIAWTQTGSNIGLSQTSGTGSIPSFVTVNNSLLPQTATFEITPMSGNCAGKPVSFKVTVLPTVGVDAVASQELCTGQMANAVLFNGAVPGTVYRWTNSNPAIGLAAAGTGDIASFRALNSGTNVEVATITVTPEYSYAGLTCPTITPITFTITVQPTPFIAPEFDATYCVGATVAAVTGTNFTWTQTGSNIGLSQTSGTGTIPSFVTVNNTLLPQTATFEITPMSGTCAGKPVSFKVTVLPTVGVDAVASQELCTGQMTNAVLFNGVVPGTVYRWTNSNPAIGLAAAGTGDIASFRAVNSGTNVEVATITVTPEYSHAGLTCPTITPITFTITVNPELTLGSIFNAIYCDGEATDVVTLPADATWVLSGSDIGSVMSGTGSIPSFTATNKTAQPVKGVFTVTLASGTCEGSTASFEVTVNPELRLTSGTTVATAVCGGNNFNYTATSNVSGVAFAWTSSTGNSGVGAQISEVLTNSTDAPIAVTYTIEMTFVDCSATETVTVMVNPAPEVSLASVFEQVCGSASEVEFTYTVNPAQASLAIEYSINFASEALFAGFANVNNATLTGDKIVVAIPTGLPTGTYNGVVSFSAGGCTSAASSVNITIQVMGGVQILTQPTAANFCDGEGFVLSVNAIGVNVSYQWFFDNGEFVEELVGETSSTIAIAPEDAESFIGGTFFVDVISDCGTVRSVDVNVGINSLFILQRWDDVVVVSNLGDLYVDYQWYRDEKAIGLNGKFQHYNEIGGLNGTYQVLVTYADGSKQMSCPLTVLKDVESAPAAIRIYPNPVQIGKEIVVDLSQLSVEESLNAKVIIYDASGRRMTSSVIANPVENIVVNVSVAGNYIVRVTTASGRVKSEKVVVVE